MVAMRYLIPWTGETSTIGLFVFKKNIYVNNPCEESLDPYSETDETDWLAHRLPDLLLHPGTLQWTVGSVWGSEIAHLVKALGRWPCRQAQIPVKTITFSCAAIHFLPVYNLQRHQRPVLCGRLKIRWVCKSVGLGFLLILPPWYNWNTAAMA